MLSRAGHRVALVGRSGSIGAAKLTLREEVIETSLQRLEELEPEYAVITVKAYDLAATVAQHEPMLKRCRTVLCIQNGLGIVEQLRGLPNAIQGVLYVSAERRSVAEAKWWFPMRIVVDANDSRTKEIGEALQCTGIKIEWSDRFMAAVFRKLVINVTLNPITALYRLSSRAAMEREDTRRRAFAAGEELLRIAEAMGVKVDATVESIIGNISALNPNFGSSMLLDVEAGKPLELESILAEPLKLAAKYHVSAPEMTKLYHELASLNT
jgi:2-dehydropantoate 2-reductase